MTELPENLSRFTPKSAKEAEVERIMQGMPGAPGMKMYSREELMNQGFGGDEEEEDDDDDESDFASNLKKAMREKGTTERTWKEKAAESIKDTVATLKRHASRASDKIRQWWNAKRSIYEKQKSSKEEL